MTIARYGSLVGWSGIVLAVWLFGVALLWSGGSHSVADAQIDPRTNSSVMKFVLLTTAGLVSSVGCILIKNNALRSICVGITMAALLPAATIWIIGT